MVIVVTIVRMPNHLRTNVHHYLLASPALYDPHGDLGAVFICVVGLGIADFEKIFVFAGPVVSPYACAGLGPGVCTGDSYLWRPPLFRFAKSCRNLNVERPGYAKDAVFPRICGSSVW